MKSYLALASLLLVALALGFATVQGYPQAALQKAVRIHARDHHVSDPASLAQDRLAEHLEREIATRREFKIQLETTKHLAEVELGLAGRRRMLEEEAEQEIKWLRTMAERICEYKPEPQGLPIESEASEARWTPVGVTAKNPAIAISRQNWQIVELCLDDGRLQTCRGHRAVDSQDVVWDELALLELHHRLASLR